VNSKSTEQIEKISHLLSIQPAAALIPDNKEGWSPSTGFGAVIRDLGPIAFRVALPHSAGEERLLSGWLHNWKEQHPHFLCLGSTTPLEYLFDVYSRCNAAHANLKEKCVAIAIYMPWNDPSMRSGKPLTLDPITHRKILSRFNFPALLELVQHYCELCRRVLNDPRFTSYEAYNLVAAVDTFSREAFSVLAEESKRTIEGLWIKYSESTQIAEEGHVIMQESAWDDMRTALFHQYLGIANLIKSIWRLQVQDKMLDFIVNTGLMLTTLLAEELASSGNRRKGDLPLSWDSKALLWQALYTRLRTTPLVIGGDEPGHADVLFSVFASCGALGVHYGGRRLFDTILRWSSLLSNWQLLQKNKGIKEVAHWYQTIRGHPKGNLAKDFILLYNFQLLFYSCLNELSHYYHNILRFKQRGQSPIPNELQKLFPPFLLVENNEVTLLEVSPSVKSLVGE
jgi:hypothetical protein